MQNFNQLCSHSVSTTPVAMNPPVPETSFDYLYNSKYCMVCNVPFFCSHNNTQRLNHIVYLKQGFCNLFGVEADSTFNEELSPFCMECELKANELCRLNNELQRLQGDLNRILDEIGFGVVNSFSSAYCNRPGYFIKRQIYEKWFKKCNHSEWNIQHQIVAENHYPIPENDSQIRFCPSNSQTTLAKPNYAPLRILSAEEDLLLANNTQTESGNESYTELLPPQSPLLEQENLSNKCKSIVEIDIRSSSSDDSKTEISEKRSSSRKKRKGSKKRKHNRSSTSHSDGKKRKNLNSTTKDDKVKKCKSRINLSSIPTELETSEQIVDTVTDNDHSKHRVKSKSKKRKKSRKDSNHRLKSKTRKRKKISEASESIISEEKNSESLRTDCGGEIGTQSLLNNSSVIDESLKNNKCENCDHVSSSVLDLKQHTETVHANVERENCTIICSEPCSGESGHPKLHEQTLETSHVAAEHDAKDTPDLGSNSAKTPSFKCPHCPDDTRRMFSSRQSRHRHMKNIHKIPSKPQTKPKSGQNFEDCNENERILNSTVVEAPVKPKGVIPKPRRKKREPPETNKKSHIYQCTYCEKIWKDKPTLVKHVRTHTGEKPYKCRLCDKNFTDHGNRRKHEKTHDVSRFEGEPKLQCPDCDKKFHIQGSLYHHRMKIHLNIKFKKKTQCEHCGQVLNSAWGLKHHIATVHEKIYYVNCTICGRPCRNELSRKSHERTHEAKRKHVILFHYKCPECSSPQLSFRNKRDLLRHFGKMHVGKVVPHLESIRRKTSYLKCPHCIDNPQWFSIRSSLSRHIQNVHTHPRNNVNRSHKRSFKLLIKKKITKTKYVDLDVETKSEFEIENEEYSVSRRRTQKTSVIRKSCHRVESVKKNILLENDSCSTDKHVLKDQEVRSKIIVEETGRIGDVFENLAQIKLAKISCGNINVPDNPERETGFQDIGDKILRIHLQRIDLGDSNCQIQLSSKTEQNVRDPIKLQDTCNSNQHVILSPESQENPIGKIRIVDIRSICDESETESNDTIKENPKKAVHQRFRRLPPPLPNVPNPFHINPKIPVRTYSRHRLYNQNLIRHSDVSNPVQPISIINTTAMSEVSTPTLIASLDITENESFRTDEVLLGI